jgi:hypothetical protein
VTVSLEPDELEIRRFVGLMFQHAIPGSWVAQRLFEDGSHRPYRPNSWKWVQIKSAGLDNIVARALEMSLLAASAAVAVVFACPVCTFKTPDRAKDSNVADGLVVSVECDERPLAG